MFDYLENNKRASEFAKIETEKLLEGIFEI